MGNNDTQKNAAAEQSQVKKRMPKITKKELVLAYLVKYRSITPAEAQNACSHWRLSAVIREFRVLGIPIKTHEEPHENGFHARYELLSLPHAEQHLRLLQSRRQG